MNILIYSGMAFHYRSLLPIMKKLVEDGHNVNVLARGIFSKRRIRNKPRAFNVISRGSLNFVCKEIGIGSEFLNKVNFIPYIRRLNIPTRSFYKKIDIFISTTKGFRWLNEMVVYEKPRIAIAYQNMLGTYFTTENILFPSTCPPDLSFEAYMRDKYKIDYIDTGLPFLDSYVERSKKYKNNNSTNKILFLHPGGYRGVISNMGDSKELSIKKQREFYLEILKSIPSDKKLTVKIHPLAARYHDLKTNIKYFSDLDIDFIDGFLGDCLFEYDAVLSIGSSALFEVLPFKPIFIIGYLSKVRASYYKELNGIYFTNKDDLYNALNQIDKYKSYINDFHKKLSILANGKAVERIYRLIIELTNS
ncbi:MAG: hypothetical protein ACTSRG_26370 [Candidatus Helarchaeota archaeon]